jgi:hypothetical protein
MGSPHLCGPYPHFAERLHSCSLLPPGFLVALPISYFFIPMSNNFMRNVMPVWMALSALYPIFAAAFVFRALSRMRRLKEMRREATAPALPAFPLNEAQDWIPTR